MISKGDNVDETVTRVLRRREDDYPYGLLVDIGGIAFVPRSLVPLDQREDLDALVGMWMTGAILKVDEKRGTVVIDPYFGAHIPPPSSTDIAISDEYLSGLARQYAPNRACG